jgi:phosphate transport system substrate-binding protein
MISRKVLAVSVIVIVILATIGLVLVLNKPTEEKKVRVFIDQAGSETMYDLCLKWAKDYGANNASVIINVTRGGSGPGIASLLTGEVDIAQTSRQMRSDELEMAASQGMQIVEVKVALDGIAMLVNPVNNITTLTIDQLKSIYNGSVTSWKALGGADIPILAYGRNNTSGTYSFFQEHVLNNGNYGANISEYDNYDIMIADINSPSHPGAIGYVGVGFVNNYPDVKILSLKKDDSSPAYAPEKVYVESFDYPLARYLYLYLSEKPTGALLNYIEWIIDLDQGQSVVTKEGFYPIPQEVHDRDMALLS